MSGWTVNRIRATAGSSGRVRATYIQWARREVGIPAFDSRAVEQQPAGGGLLPTDPRLPFSFLPRVAWPWMEVWARVDLTRRRSLRQTRSAPSRRPQGREAGHDMPPSE